MNDLKDEQFIEAEAGWPIWPILFIKKRGGGLLNENLGFIWGSLDRKSGEPHKCYLECNYYSPETWEGKEPVMMTSKEIVDAGWVVD